MIDAYYKLEVLSKDLAEYNKIKSRNRFDCISFTDEYLGINSFINKKGMFYMYLNNPKHIVKSRNERKSNLLLTSQGLNFTSLYNEFDGSKYYGYPNENLKLKNGDLNPLYNFRNDIYLFEISSDFKSIDLFIIKNQKGLVSQIYQMFIDGEFETEIEEIKSKTKPFFNY